ncbi:hypothetical protein Afil01_28610 [Actinorhabdospora filicis]|uniref:DUF11 domain-containing protein n=1 Tax=Actinorhabdospora filicis TaxID=1785913 RepID=A0A9W6SLQ1_9ACTN|nr:hypothetical protein Afil01_28610 [Actinorhabdospora filicis]
MATPAEPAPSAAPVRLPEAGGCGPFAYTSVGTGPSDLYRFDPVLGTMTKIAGTTWKDGYDAIGYSRATGRVYGAQVGGDKSKNFVEIDPEAGTVKKIPYSGTIAVSDSSYDQGDVSPDGREYYITRTSSGGAFVINLDPSRGAVGLVLRKVEGSGTYDLAYHPNDGFIYTLSSSGVLYRIDPATGKSTTGRTVVSPSNSSFQALVFSSDGYMFAVNSESPQKVYQLDLSSSTAASPIDISKAPLATQSGTIKPGTSVADGGGCLQMDDYGDAPDTYGTSAPTGPEHNSVTGLKLGAGIDQEPNARPSTSGGVTGELDGRGDNFDDGVSSWPALYTDATTYTVDVAVTNTTGKSVTLAGWLDFNGDGTFGTGERATATVAVNASTAKLSWTGLSGLVSGASFARLRLYDTAVADPAPGGGLSGNGEVEDYPVGIRVPLGARCTPTPYVAVGTGPTSLSRFDPMTGTVTALDDTSYTNGYDAIGVSGINGRIYGTTRGADRYTKIVEVNPAGGVTEFPISPALTSNSTSNYDVGAISPDGTKLYVHSNSSVPSFIVNLDPAAGRIGTRLDQFTVKVSGLYDWAFHPVDGYLYAVDSSGYLMRIDPADGTVTKARSALLPKAQYQGAFFDTEGDLYVLDNSSPGKVFQIDLSASKADKLISLDGVSFAQSSAISTTQAVSDAGGCLSVGDFGDAPDSYLTSIASDGPAHDLSAGLRLGAKSDAEPDARRPITDGVAGPLNGLGDNYDDAIATVAALGKDDTSYTASVKVTNTTGKAVTLAGWFDANLDGKFQPGERVLLSVPSAAGEQTVTLTWTVSTLRPSGTTYLRLRLFDDARTDPSPSGVAGFGEVEDYPVTVTSHPRIDLKIATDPLTLAPGASGVLPVRVTNDGPDASDIPATVTLTPPTGTTFGTPPSGCVKNSDGTVTCTIPAADLAKGATKNLAIPITVNSDAPPNSTPLPGGSAVVSSPRDTNPANNTAPITVNTGASTVDVAVKSASAPGPLAPGSATTVTVTATNNGPSNTAGAATVTITLPQNVTQSGALPAGCVLNGDGTVTCTVASGWAAGSDKTFAIPVVIASNAPLNATLTGGKAVIALTGDTVAGNNSRDFTMSTTAKAATDLAVTAATADPATPLTPGSPASVTVTAKNLGPSDSRSASTVTITLPEHVSVNGALPAGCTGTGPVTCTVASGWVSGAEKSFVIPVKVDSDAPLNATLSGGKAVVSGADDTVDTNNEKPFTMSTTAKAATDLSVTAATVSPSGALAPGSTATVTVTGKNLGPSDTRSESTITITLPEHVSVAGALPAGCTGTGPVACKVPAGWVPGADKTFAIPVKIAADAPLDTTLTGGKAVVSGADDTVDTNNEKPFTMSTTAKASTDLAVTAAAADPAGPLAPGSTATVNVTARNLGPSDTHSASTVTITLPANVSVSGALPTGCTGTGPITCTVASPWAAGTDKSFAIPVKIASSAPLDTTLTGGKAVVAGDDDTVGANNEKTFTMSTTSKASTDLAVTAATVDPAGPSAPGSTATVNVTAKNVGPSDSRSESTVTITLPEHVSVAGALPAGCTGTGPVTCKVPAGWVADAEKAFAIPVKIASDAPLNTTLNGGKAVVAGADDTVAGNNEKTFTMSTTGTAATDLAVTAATVTPSGALAPGSPATVNVTASNVGPSTSRSDATVTVTLPEHVSVAGALPAGCTGTGPITCTVAAGWAVGTDKSFAIPVKIASDAPLDTTLNGGKAVVAGADDTVAGNNEKTFTMSTTAKAATDLAVTAATVAPPGAQAPGSTATVTVTASNVGPSDSRSESTITITLPEHVTATGPLPSGCTGTGPVVCKVPAGWTAGGDKTFAIPVAIAPDAPLNTTLNGGKAVVSGADDTVAGNNEKTFTMSTTGTASTDLAVTATAVSPAGPLAPGSTAEVTVTATNVGPSVSRSAATVTITLPEKVSLAGDLPAGCTGTGPITCTVAAGWTVGTYKPFVIPVRIASDAPLDTTLNGGKAVVAGSDDTVADNNSRDFTMSTTAKASTDLAVTAAAVSPTGALAPGSTATVDVTAKNVGPSDSRSESTVTITLPEHVTATGPLPAGCTGTGPVVCTVAAGWVAGAEKTFAIPVTIASDAPLDSTLAGGKAAVAGADDTVDTNNEKPFTMKTTGAASTDLAVTTATVDPAGPSAPGSTATVTITANNVGPSDSRSASTVTITLPQHVTVSGALPVGCTGTGPVVCKVPAGWTAGTDRTFAIPVKIAPDAPLDTTLNGGKAVVKGDDDTVAGNNSRDFTMSTTAKGSTDLAVTAATVEPAGALPPGSTATVTVTASNVGPSDSRSESTVTITLPQDVTATGPLPAGCTGTGPVTCKVPAGWAVGAEKSFTIPVKIASGAALDTTLTGGKAVASGADDTVAANNEKPFTMSTTARASTDLAVTSATVDPSGALAPGSTATVNVTAKNVGPSDSRSESTITITLPEHVSVAGTLPAGCTGAGPVTCTVAAGWVADAEKTFAIPVRIAADAPLDTTLNGGKAVVAGADDTVAGNNEKPFTMSTTAKASTDLAVTAATVDPSGALAPGSPATVNVTAKNVGPSDSRSESTVTITLPEHVTATGPLPSGCSGTGPVVCKVPAGWAVDAQKSFAIPVVIASDAPLDTTLNGGKAVVAGSDDTVDTNNEKPFTMKTTATASTDLAVTAAVVNPAGPLAPGSTAEVTVTANNVGPSTSRSAATVTITLPEHVSVAGALPAGCTGTGPVTCTVAAGWAVGSFKPFVIPVKIASGAPLDTTLNGGKGVVAGADDTVDTNNEKPFTMSTTAKASTDLAVTAATVSPSGALAPGSTATVNVTARNVGPSDSRSESTVTITLPEHVTATGPLPAGCTGTGPVTCKVPAGWGAGEDKSFAIPVRIASDAPLDTTLNGGKAVVSGADDTVDTNNEKPFTMSTTAKASTDLAVTAATVDPAAAQAPGSTATVNVTAKNVGPSDSRSESTVTITLPQHVTATGPLPSGCTGTGPVTCKVPAGWAADGEKTFVIPVKIASDAPLDTTLTGGKAVVSGADDTVDTNNEKPFTMSTTAKASTDLAVTAVAVDPAGPLAPGSAATVTVTATNVGPSDSRSESTVTITLPEHVTATGPLPAGCTGTGPVTCKVPSGWVVGSFKPFVIPVKIASGAPLATTLNGGKAVVSGSDDTVDTNNEKTFTMSTTAKASTDLAVTAATVDPSGALAPGSTATVNVTANNVGPSDSRSESTITITLPEHVSVAGTLPAGCTGTGPVTCKVPAGWVAGEDKSFAIPVKIASAAPLNTTLAGGKAVVSGADDTVDTNNEKPFTMETTGAASTDLAVTAATVDPSGALPPGATATVNVTASNVGPSDSRSESTVTITLPQRVTATGPLPSGCTGTGPVTCKIPAGWAVGTDKTFAIPVKIASDAPLATTLTGGKATVSGADDTVAGNNEKTFTMSTTAKASTDLTVTAATVNPAGALPPGATATVNVTAKNLGPSGTRSESTVTITLPQDVTVEGDLPDGCTGTGPVTCKVPAGWVAGAEKTFAIPVQISSEAPLATTLTGGKATVSGADDTVAGNNEKTFTMKTTGAASTDLAVTAATVSPSGALPPGSTATVTVEATNVGPSDSRSESTITITLPQYVTATGPLPAGCTGTGPVTCKIPAGWAVDEDKSFAIPVQIASNAPLSSTLAGGKAVVTGADDSIDDNNEKTFTMSTTAKASNDLSVTVTGPGTLPPGGSGQVTVTGRNNGPSDTSKPSTITVTIPDGATVGTLPAGCTGTGPVVCTIPAGWTVGTDKTFVIPVTVAADTEPDTTLTGGEAVVANPDDGVDTNNRATYDIPVGPRSADVAITKAPAGNTKVAPGDTFDYEVTVTNNGPSDAVGVQVTDKLPAALTFVSSTPAGCTAAGQDVTCPKIATLAAKGVKVYKLTVRLDPAYTGDGSDVRNVAKVAADSPDPKPDNNTSSPDTGTLPDGGPATPKADLAITKATANDTKVAPGETFDYVLTVTNKGPSVAKDVVVTDELPAELAFVSSSPGGCTVSDRTVTCPKTATLGPLGTVTYTLTVRLDSAYTGDGSEIVNTGKVTASTSDPVTANNTATAGLPGGNTAAAKADLKVTKATADNTKVVPGKEFDYTLTMTNDGPSVARGAQLVDTLPSALTWVSGCAASGKTVTCAKEDALAVGATKTYTIRVRLASGYAGDGTGTDVTNSATVSATTADPQASNNTATAKLPGGGPAKREWDLGIAAEGPATPVTPGGNGTVKVTVTHNGPSDTDTATTVTITLPAKVTPGTLPAGCAGTGPVTCTIPAGFVAGTTKVIELPIIVAADATPNTTITGGKADVAITGDTDASNDSAPFTVPVAGASADVAVTKTPVGKTRVAPGEEFDYEITVTNKGLSDAVNVKVTDRLPAALAWVSGCAATGQDVTCPTVATLAAGDSKKFTVRVRLDAAYTGDGSDIRNVAAAASDTTDPDTSNNTSNPDTGTLPDGGPAPKKIDLATAVTAPTTGVTPGTSTTVTVTITNNGPSNTGATAVHVITLPEKTSVGAPLPAGCTGTGPVTCTVPASLAPGGTKEYVIPLIVAADAPENSTLSGGKDEVKEPLDGVPANNTATFTIPTGTRSADLAITKAPVGKTRVAPGETFEYEVTVTNNGPSDAAGVQVSDTLPDALKYVSSNPAGCTAVNQKVTCPKIAVLAAKGVQVYKLTVRLDAGYAGDGSDIRNVATVAADSADPDTSNNTSGADTGTLPDGGPAPAKADLWITKSLGAPVPRPGEETVYRLEVVNNGPSNAAGVKITDTLQQVWTFVSSPDGCTANGQAVTCAIGTMAAGETAVRTIRVRLDPAYTGSGGLRNTATVSADTADPDTSNNSASHMIQDGSIPIPKTDMSVVKTIGSTKPIAPGETFDYQITATNNGSATSAVNVVISDPLPAMLSFVSSSPAGCTAKGRLVTCPKVAKVAPGEKITYTLTVRLDPAYTGNGSDIKNTAKVTADNVDPDDSNNQSTVDGLPDDQILPASADVAISVVEPAGRVIPGAADKLLVTLRNLGPSTVRGEIPVEIVMPANVTAGSGLPATCTASDRGRVVRCRVGDGLAPESARIEAATAFTIPITVASSAPANAILPGGTAVHTRSGDPVLENNSTTWVVRTGDRRPTPPPPSPTADPIPVTGSRLWPIAGWGLGLLLIGAFFALYTRSRRDKENR